MRADVRASTSRSTCLCVCVCVMSSGVGGSSLRIPLGLGQSRRSDESMRYEGCVSQKTQSLLVQAPCSGAPFGAFRTDLGPRPCSEQLHSCESKPNPQSKPPYVRVFHLQHTVKVSVNLAFTLTSGAALKTCSKQVQRIDFTQSMMQ